MRVIAGTYRGRTLTTPSGESTRPILDRVKGALFDWLGSRLLLPGHLPPINVCDLFCGGGSQGIESLSRGAAYCTFVERDPAALKCLRANLTALKITSQFEIVNRPAESITLKRVNGRGYSIVFVDPPYRFSEDVSVDSIMGRVAARIGVQIPTEPDALVLWRHDEQCRLPDRLPNGWHQTDRRTWGSNTITLFEQGGLEDT
ncbi:MAG: RsmD family RNA methyltransferase [Phycisphaerae bacterium]|nr:RsmD family RNA methyltransferase [Phycisphaerae bacterium]